jgi:hypothetical protein
MRINFQRYKTTTSKLVTKDETDVIYLGATYVFELDIGKFGISFSFSLWDSIAEVPGVPYEY